MDESVWLYIGILSFIIGIGVIISLIHDYKNDFSSNSFFQDIDSFENHIDLVCSSPKDTKLSQSITVPKGALLYNYNNKLCGLFDNKIKCVPSTCPLYVENDENKRVLVNLTGNTPFNTITYSCSFDKQDSIIINCQG